MTDRIQNDAIAALRDLVEAIPANWYSGMRSVNQRESISSAVQRAKQVLKLQGKQDRKKEA